MEDDEPIAAMETVNIVRRREVPPLMPEVERFSRWETLVGTVAWALKFVAVLTRTAKKDGCMEEQKCAARGKIHQFAQLDLTLKEKERFSAFLSAKLSSFISAMILSTTS